MEITKKKESNWEHGYTTGLRTGFCSTLALAIPLLFGSIATTYTLTKEHIREEDANRAKMCLYEPVGNGGALSEMNHHFTPKREEMYARMNDVYTAVLDKK
ncbi:MAG: hypothetical protein ABIJ21_00250 [Nanoarchaeota archaeon]